MKSQEPGAIPGAKKFAMVTACVGPRRIEMAVRLETCWEKPRKCTTVANAEQDDFIDRAVV